VLQAAIVLFGRRFLPFYPQCELRMARFRGTDKTEFLDHKQVRAGAFKLLEEAELFCQRHLPVPAKIVSGQMRRVESHLIPPSGLREILVNALIHRDYSIAGGAISLAIFDDRLEVWSAGGFPRGITPELLSREHHSVQRNPLIADAFHRAGFIEKWGRGTNRVIEMCREAGTALPEFSQVGEAAVVSFRVKVGATAHVTPQVNPQVTPQVRAILRAAIDCPRTRAQLQLAAGMLDREHFRTRTLRDLLSAELLERTIPERPNSRLQQYRLTPKGRKLISGDRR
jgi:ATP-dependent DNA helicase RecG